jgi:hypothetical protein
MSATQAISAEKRARLMVACASTLGRVRNFGLTRTFPAPQASVAILSAWTPTARGEANKKTPHESKIFVERQ